MIPGGGGGGLGAYVSIAASILLRHDEDSRSLLLQEVAVRGIERCCDLWFLRQSHGRALRVGAQLTRCSARPSQCSTSAGVKCLMGPVDHAKAHVSSCGPQDVLGQLTEDLSPPTEWPPPRVPWPSPAPPSPGSWSPPPDRPCQFARSTGHLMHDLIGHFDIGRSPSSLRESQTRSNAVVA